MKIIRLKSENVMRLVAVDITPDGNMVIVGGKNGAGKSSVLNSIAMALGGAAMCPQEPIRAGETEAKIVIELDDLIVTRKFSRSRFACNCDDDEREKTGKHSEACATRTFGETTSTLTVTNKDGARYPSPQALLDKLLGKLTFDPLAFARMEPKAQDDALRKLVGLDVSAIDERRREAFQRRAMLKKTYEIKIAQLLAMPHHDGDVVEVPMAEISAEMLRAEKLRIEAEDAGRKVSVQKEAIDSERRLLTAYNQQRDEIAKQLAALDAKITASEKHLIGMDLSLVEKQAAHEATLIAVPNADALRQRLYDAEVMNKRVRENAAYDKAKNEVRDLDTQIEDQDALVKAADEEKRTLLASATFPVEGLGLSDDGVTFGGLPFAQASSSEQLRVSVAIGLALNPKLKVLLIRSGNLLDDEHLAELAKQAEAAEAQVWMEYVTANAEGVSVMIEDGKVADAD